MLRQITQLSLTAAALLAATVIPASAAAATATTVSGAADGKCIEQATTKAFERFGDQADYSVAPGGDFEDGTNGWTFTKSRIVDGNETAGVLGGSHSVALGLGLVGSSTAVSPAFCVGEEHPTFRYLYRATGLVGFLSTWIRYTDIDGSTEEVQVHSRTATNLLPGRWRPSDLQPLATKIPLVRAGGTARVQLVFRSPINLIGSGYQIDSVLVDPYRRG